MTILFQLQIGLKQNKRLPTEYFRKLAVAVIEGVIDPNQGHRGVFVTTSSFTSSSFTSDAVKFAEPLEHCLTLRDYEDLKEWLSEYRNKTMYGASI